jgi:hypothetical protein
MSPFGKRLEDSGLEDVANTPKPVVIPSETGSKIIGADPHQAEEQFPFPSEYLDEILVCRQLQKALGEGITDPLKLAEVCGLPVCLVAKSKFSGINSIAAEAIAVQLDRHRRGQHALKLAEKHTGKSDSRLLEFPEYVCYLRELRAKAIIEFGLSGWDDPLKLSSAVGLPVCLVMKGLEHLGYERYERSGGCIGYKQKKADTLGKTEA